MIPVSCLDDVRIRWLEIRKHGFVLHGFLLYTNADQYFPEYIADEGLTDLDSWTGDKCGIFLLHDPPPDWIAYTKESDHIWWHTYGQPAESTLLSGPISEIFLRVNLC